MTMATATRGVPGRATEQPRGGVFQMTRDSWVLARRNLRRMTRIPEIVVFGLMEPVMFVLLFTFVLGGAIEVPGGGYREFLMAGIFAETVAFAVQGASAGVADDMTRGLVDRFRSLPMARSAVLAGRTVADVVQNAFVLLVLVLMFRPTGILGESLGRARA